MIGIGDFDKVNRRGKITREGQVKFDGKLYSKNKSGYYLCTSGERKRLHVAVWRKRWRRARGSRWLCNTSFRLE